MIWHWRNKLTNHLSCGIHTVYINRFLRSYHIIKCAIEQSPATLHFLHSMENLKKYNNKTASKEQTVVLCCSSNNLWWCVHFPFWLNVVFNTSIVIIQRQWMNLKEILQLCIMFINSSCFPYTVLFYSSLPFSLTSSIHY